MLDVFALCAENCKHPTYTREQFLTLLQQVIEAGNLNSINPELPVFEKIKEIRAGNAIRFWSGTEAQFNELGIAADGYTSVVFRVADDGTIYICTNDTTLESIIKRFDAIEEEIKGMETDSDLTNYAKKSTITAVTISEWQETMNVTVSGVTATSPVEIIPGDGITADQLKALQRANIVDGGEQSSGTVSMKLLGEIPTISIPVKFIARGDL